ncbi:MAG: hypothetical protein NC390_00085 [Fusobacterium sp.]|nr:hypothetical protein [Fusobacterium sp.]
MEIQRINNTMSFKSYTSDDLYRLEKKLDSLQSSMDRNDLNSFYKSLPKERRMPMPLGVPPYAIGGMMGMPPMGPMGRPPMGMMGPMGMMPPAGGMYGMPMGMGMPPMGAPMPRIGGQPPMDTFGPRR